MFKTFEQTITVTIAIIVSAVLIISCTVSYQTSKNMLNTDFSEKAARISNQYNETLSSYLSMIRENFSIVINNSIIKKALTDNEYNYEITSILDNVINSNIGIIGITVYGIDNGVLYHTDSISNPPPYSELITNQIPESFVISPKNMTSIIRRENISQYYDSVQYGQKVVGIYTYITKILNNNNELCGIMVLDMPLSDLFEFYNRQEKFAEVMDVFIKTGDGTIYASNNNTHSINAYEEKKLKYILINKKLLNEDTETAVYIPMYTLTRQLNKILLYQIMFSLIILMLCLIFTRILTKSIIKPIEELKENVKNDVLTGEDDD